MALSTIYSVRVAFIAEPEVYCWWKRAYMNAVEEMFQLLSARLTCNNASGVHASVCILAWMHF